MKKKKKCLVGYEGVLFVVMWVCWCGWAPALPSKWLVRCALSERVCGFVGGHLRSCLSSLPHVVTRPVLVCLYGRPGHAFMVGYFVRCAAGARRMSLCRSVVPLGVFCAVCGWSPPPAWRCVVLFFSVVPLGALCAVCGWSRPQTLRLRASVCLGDTFRHDHCLTH